mmetsp:Transcript_6033/g.10986  ORF Transcript_6033/g.10986 Transcript_6033/m.10986 type:complete len:215 (+) Transcript_6033:893-1537(+)
MTLMCSSSINFSASPASKYWSHMFAMLWASPVSGSLLSNHSEGIFFKSLSNKDMSRLILSFLTSIMTPLTMVPFWNLSSPSSSPSSYMTPSNSLLLWAKPLRPLSYLILMPKLLTLMTFPTSSLPILKAWSDSPMSSSNSFALSSSLVDFVQSCLVGILGSRKGHLSSLLIISMMLFLLSFTWLSMLAAYASKSSSPILSIQWSSLSPKNGSNL